MAYILKGGIQGNPGSGNHPKKWPLTGTIRLKDISGNNLPFQILTGRPANQEVGRRGSIRIRKDSIA